MVYSDYHIHTSFSTDSSTPAGKMIEGAISKGMKSVCITDHFDQDYPKDPELGEHPFQIDLPKYFETLHALQQEYKSRINVRIGIELGLQPHLSGFYQNLTENYPFDFVIGSVHLVDGKDPYFKEYFTDMTDEQLYERTFQLTLENLDQIHCFDVLGHIDYVVRYGKQQEKHYTYIHYADLIDEILKRIIAGGKGIELNTAGFKYGLPFAHPHPDVLRRYRELGGEIITIGSDGHKPEHIAWDFGKVGSILKDCGFKYYTEFESRKPIFKQLP